MPARFGLQDNAGKGAPYRGKKLAKRMRSHKSNLSLARRSDNSMSMRSRHPAALALLSLLGAFCVVACATPLWAQSQTEPLKTFTDPDDAFSFRYSNNLIHCEQKKQGNSEQLYWDPGESCSAYHPVCDELLAGERHTSIVCFGYPRNKFTDTRAFEAATFSVEVVDDSTTEKSCLAGLTDADADKKGITKINGVSFSVFGLGSLGSNQSVNVDLYRTFYRGKCYQLGIDVATAAAAVFDPHARDLTDADWNEVNGTLEQARKSFRFLNTTAIAHSWFLMITPIGKDGQSDTSVPLSHWDAHTFDSKYDCEHALEVAHLSEAQGAASWSLRTGLTEQETKALLYSRDWLCVASDDPRLKEK